MLAGIFNAVGTLTVRDEAYAIIGEPGDAGFLQYGPYLDLPAGRYTVTWRLPEAARDLAGLPPDTLSCHADVTAQHGAVSLARMSLSAGDILSAGGRISLPFQATERCEVEFRMFTTGLARVVLDPMREVVRDDGSVVFRDADHMADYSPVLERGQRPLDSFFIRNFDIFQLIHSWDIGFTSTSQGVIGKVRETRFTVRNREDAQIVGEVFVLKQYACTVPGEATVIDIGMNVGLASLYFAELPHVREVFSFEPFQIPFDRALENIGLNPGLKQKITPRQVGLSDQNATLAVAHSPDATISVSTRGVGGPATTSIEVRDAAETLGPIIRAARAANRAVIMKVDCEGSEFAIFESLGRAGLLGDVDVVLMEWHKWWDPAKTQADLIAPLLALDFVVLDRTEDRNPHAGFITAVRRRAGARA